MPPSLNGTIRLSAVIHIVMYHYIRTTTDWPYPRLKAVDLTEFVSQIDALAERYRIIGPERLIEGRLDPDVEYAMLTFDDGYREHYTTVHPLLEMRGIPAVYFVNAKALTERRLLNVNKIHLLLATETPPTQLLRILEDVYRAEQDSSDPPDIREVIDRIPNDHRYDDRETTVFKRLLQRDLPFLFRSRILDVMFHRLVGDEDRFVSRLYMTSDEAARMISDGAHLGGHGYEHDWYAHMSDEEIHSDVAACAQTIDTLVHGRYAPAFAYPYGSYSEGAKHHVESLGFSMAFTTFPQAALHGEHHRFAMPRWDVRDLFPALEIGTIQITES
jgi:peptidoglycan/xylan/chitin deacetylase (PgdA/CDA1 family)